MSRVLIITKSFVREIHDLVHYVTRTGQPFQFALVMPDDQNIPEPFPASVSKRRVYIPNHIRAACYLPTLLRDIHTFRPDILQIFEEYSGLIAFQSLICKHLLRQKAKTLVYSAENITGNVHPVFRVPMKYVMKWTDLAFVCSYGVKQILQDEGFTKPVEVFPLGVDTSLFYKFSTDQLKTELKLDGKFVIGYTGRLLEMKGVSLLVRLLQYLPENVHLLLVGTGPQERHLRMLAATHQLEYRMHFAGNVPYGQLPKFINCMDVGVVPSKTTKRWKEQFGRVLIEFMSCEIPVIGSDSGSIPEVLENTGCVFKEDDFQELLSLVKMLMGSAEKRQKLGKLGRKRVLSYYSNEIMGERFLTIYQNLVQN